MKYSIFTVLLLACIASTLRAESPFERELKQLREQRDKTVAAAVEPINRKYQVSLDQLLRRATQGNDLQAAMKIKQEMETSAASIAALTTEPPKNRAARINTELSGSIWSVLRGDRTITVTFAPEGAAFSTVLQVRVRCRADQKSPTNPNLVSISLNTHLIVTIL